MEGTTTGSFTLMSRRGETCGSEEQKVRKCWKVLSGFLAELLIDSCSLSLFLDTFSALCGCYRVYLIILKSVLTKCLLF